MNETLSLLSVPRAQTTDGNLSSSTLNPEMAPLNIFRPNHPGNQPTLPKAEVTATTKKDAEPHKVPFSAHQHAEFRVPATSESQDLTSAPIFKKKIKEAVPFRTNAFDDTSNPGQTNTPSPLPMTVKERAASSEYSPQPRQNTLIPRPFNQSHAEPRKVTVLPSHFTMVGPFGIPV